MFRSRYVEAGDSSRETPRSGNPPELLWLYGLIRSRKPWCPSQVRKVTQRQARRPTGEVVRPEEMESVQEKEKQETDRNLEEM